MSLDLVCYNRRSEQDLREELSVHGLDRVIFFWGGGVGAWGSFGWANWQHWKTKGGRMMTARETEKQEKLALGRRSRGLSDWTEAGFFFFLVFFFLFIHLIRCLPVRPVGVFWRERGLDPRSGLRCDKNRKLLLACSRWLPAVVLIRPQTRPG